VTPINISSSGGFFPWQPGCWLRAQGADAATFLQGQFTNDLRALERQRAVYGLWLSVKGKVIADSFVLRGESADSFWIGSYASPAAVVRERLESHVIADEVVLEDFTAAWIGRSLFGEIAAGVLGATGLPGFVFPGRRARADTAEWVLPAAVAAAAGTRLDGIPELDAESVERIRIAQCIPAIPLDIGPADLPNEGGLEADAISYTKGCYLGQEVMARLKSMGQVRRHLRRVQGSGEIPALPAPLHAGGRQVGELRSAVREGPDGFIGLAMLSRLNVGPSAELALVPGAAANVRLMESS
jgi:tRNA-modifying protein YgfZ